MDECLRFDEGDTSYVMEDNNSHDNNVRRNNGRAGTNSNISSSSRKQQQKQRHRQSRQRQSSAKKKQSKASSSSSSDSRSTCEQHQQQMCCQQEQDDVEPPCGSLCQNKVMNSPERHPLPLTSNNHKLNESMNMNMNMNSIIYDHDDISADEMAFSNRQWLVFPEQQYDMNTMHSSLPPFLGSMYWTAASPLPAKTTTTSQQLSSQQSQSRQRRRQQVRLPLPGSTNNDDGGKREKQFFPSLITPSSLADSPMETSHDCNSSTPFNRFGIQGNDKLIPSLHSTQDWESEATSVSSDTRGDDDDENDDCLMNLIHNSADQETSFSNALSPRNTVDISRELLDYSHLEESYILESKRSHQPPRRLFDNRDDDFMMTDALDESFEVVAAPSRANNQQTKSHTTKQGRVSGGRNLSSILCMAPTPSWTATEYPSTTNCNSSNLAQNHGQTRSVSISPPIASCPSSPNISTFYGHWGSRRERHVSTLPSPNSGEPIRLRVTDKCNNVSFGGLSSGGGRIGHTLSNSNSYSSPGDCFSYDPYFSSGKYTITLPNGHAYGNGLVMKMGGGQFMILEDSRGAVLAVIKSRYTHTPSMVVYATKRRFRGQVASGHQLTRQTKQGKNNVAVVVDGNGQNGGMMGNDIGGEALYPWALISKGGRTMGDDCTIHLVNDEVKSSLKGTMHNSGRRAGSANSSSSSFGMFHSKPCFRGRHGFDRELHTHTVVSRTSASTSFASSSTSSTRDPKSIGKSNNNNGNSNMTTSLEEVPCCVIVRDSSNLDAVDITIAPGIDPLLMICYLASHSKMDVEPIMIGY